LRAIKEEWGISMTASDLRDTKAETIKNALEEKGIEFLLNLCYSLKGKMPF